MKKYSDGKGSKQMNYYGVNEKYEAIKAKAMQQAEDNGGVIDDYIADALELAEIEKEDAIFGLMYDIKNSGAELEKVKAVIADVQDKKKHLEASIDNKKLMLAAIAGAEAYSDGVVKTSCEFIFYHFLHFIGAEVREITTVFSLSETSALAGVVNVQQPLCQRREPYFSPQSLDILYQVFITKPV